ncbi:MAG: LPS export ABC transporter periplasmic protein LptC [Methylocystis sp.]|nr:LPS export ABC transporter periplasmic protein LptC [Methylocystis sp.]MBI3275428.1 LPS export ABC transporter periplasmic protein LptC [Methylocystis sp.]
MNDNARRAANRDRLGAIAAPRPSAIPDAKRHSRRVAKLRRWIIWICATILGPVLMGVAFKSLRLLPVDLRFARIGLEGSRITIETPKLVGYRKDGRPYEVRARAGVQDMNAPEIFELDGLEARIENDNDNVTMLYAAKGVYDAKHDHGEMSGGVRIHQGKRYDMRLEGASMDFRTSVLTSGQPVTLTLETGEITAQSLELAQSERRATFAGKVHSTFPGRQDDGAPDDDGAKQAAQP